MSHTKEHLNELENKSIFIIREAKKKFKNPAILWSMGKDSTALLWLCRKAFFGKIPFTVIHIDTKYKFNEIYKFRDQLANEWGLKLIVAENKEADKKKITPDKSRLECCNARKTRALKQIVKKYKIDALLVGIRRDEHGIRNKERYMSPRDKQFRWNLVKEKEKKESGDSSFISLQDPELDGWSIFATDFGKNTNHVRVHPLLHWTELEVWEYTKEQNIPVVNLYFSRNHKRFRSIGCECCCKPIKSDANSIDKIIAELKKTSTPERAGRSHDKEDQYAMQKLRSLGYM